MRNLKEHPITKAEIISFLEGLLREELQKDEVGSMNGALLHRAIMYVRKSK